MVSVVERGNFELKWLAAKLSEYLKEELAQACGKGQSLVPPLSATVGAKTSGSSYGGAFPEMKNFHERPEDVAKALRELRLQGILVGLPMQDAKGFLLFAVEGLTISTAQLLALLDRNELDVDGVRKIIGA